MAHEKFHRIYPPILQRVREMRHPLTASESKVWDKVRNRQLGSKIRRQHPIDRFIADFYCPEAKLIIEIDGDSHAEPDQTVYDLERTNWLEACGYAVIRFQNDQGHKDLETVLGNIREAIGKIIGDGERLFSIENTEGTD